MVYKKRTLSKCNNISNKKYNKNLLKTLNNNSRKRYKKPKTNNHFQTGGLNAGSLLSFAGSIIDDEVTPTNLRDDGVTPRNLRDDKKTAGKNPLDDDNILNLYKENPKLSEEDNLKAFEEGNYYALLKAYTSRMRRNPYYIIYIKNYTEALKTPKEFELK